MIDRRELLKQGAVLGGGAAFAGPVTSAFAMGRSTMFSWRVQPAESAGMSRAGLEAARLAIAKNIEAKAIAGAVTAVARHDKLVMFDAQGWADIDARVPMRTDSLFRMMSSSKVVTAVAVLMMIERGKLSLADPVSKFIPSFRNQKVAIAPRGSTDPAKVTFVRAAHDITIRDLLTHTSGLMSADQDFPAIAKLRKDVQHKPGDRLKDVIPRLGALPLDFQPGSKWRYSPLAGMDTLLYLVELVSGVPADKFLLERIFQPLDMRNTFFSVPEAQRSRLVKIYAVKDGKFETHPWLFPERNVTYFSGAGGLISCAHDMLNFELMLLHGGTFNGRRLLKPETVRLMSRNHVGSLFSDWIPPITSGHGFGLGVRIVEDAKYGGGRSVGAFGWGGAYGTETWADPALDMACVMLVQMDPGPTAVAKDFATALHQAIVT
jgi:CubicO group peptidase (beta-lactamase class C family)